MKQYVILTDTATNKPYGLVVKDDSSNVAYGAHKRAEEWARWANSQTGKSLNDLLPVGVTVSQQRALPSDGSNFIASLMSIPEIPQESLIGRREFLGSHRTNVKSTTPSGRGFQLRAFDVSGRQGAIDFKALAFQYDIKSRSVAALLRGGRYGYDIESGLIKGRKSAQAVLAGQNIADSFASRAIQRRVGLESVAYKYSIKDEFIEIEEKRLGGRIGKRIGRGLRAAPDGFVFIDVTGRVDADKDGIVFEGMPLERPIIPRFIVPQDLGNEISGMLSGVSEENEALRRAGRLTGAGMEAAEERIRQVLGRTRATQLRDAADSRAVARDGIFVPTPEGAIKVPTTEQSRRAVISNRVGRLSRVGKGGKSQIDTRDSRAVEKLTWDDDNKELIVTYNGGRVYTYSGVDDKWVRELENNPEFLGRTLNEIKKQGYPFVQGGDHAPDRTLRTGLQRERELAGMRSRRGGEDVDATELVPEANLEGADLSDQDLQKIDLSYANLNGADLNRSTLSGASFFTANLSGANMAGAEAEESVFYSANLRNADMTGIYGRRADFEDSDLRGADLSGADLVVANFTGADLTGANLRGANLYNANLSGADLRNADLRDADLTRANLDSAILTGANLDGAKLDQGWEQRVGMRSRRRPTGDPLGEAGFDDPEADEELDENIDMGLAVDPDIYVDRDGTWRRRKGGAKPSQRSRRGRASDDILGEDGFDDPEADEELEENIKLDLALDPSLQLGKDGRYYRRRTPTARSQRRSNKYERPDGYSYDPLMPVGDDVDYDRYVAWERGDWWDVSATPVHLELLANSDDIETRIGVAGHPKTYGTALTKLLNDDNETVRRAADQAIVERLGRMANMTPKNEGERREKRLARRMLAEHEEKMRTVPNMRSRTVRTPTRSGFPNDDVVRDRPTGRRLRGARDSGKRGFTAKKKNTLPSERVRDGGERFGGTRAGRYGRDAALRDQIEQTLPDGARDSDTALSRLTDFNSRAKTRSEVFPGADIFDPDNNDHADIYEAFADVDFPRARTQDFLNARAAIKETFGDSMGDDLVDALATDFARSFWDRTAHIDGANAYARSQRSAVAQFVPDESRLDTLMADDVLRNSIGNIHSRWQSGDAPRPGFVYMVDGNVISPKEVNDYFGFENPASMRSTYRGPVIGNGAMPSFDDLDSMAKIGGPLGSNGGQWYRDNTNGRTFFVKPTPTPNHAFNEAAVAAVYRAAGSSAPNISVIADSRGKPHIISEGIPNLQTLGRPDARQRAVAKLDMGIDMALSNWDVYGGGENTKWDSVTGAAIRLDTGGGGLFRARGGDKPTFNPNDPWIETATMVYGPSSQSKFLYGEVSNSDFVTAMRRVENLNLGTIDKEMADAGVPAAMRKTFIDTLGARQKMAKKYADEFSQFTPEARVNVAGQKITPGGEKLAAAPGKRGLSVFSFKRGNDTPNSRSRRGAVDDELDDERDDLASGERLVENAMGEAGFDVDPEDMPVSRRRGSEFATARSIRARSDEPGLGDDEIAGDLTIEEYGALDDAVWLINRTAKNFSDDDYRGIADLYAALANAAAANDMIVMNRDDFARAKKAVDKWMSDPDNLPGGNVADLQGVLDEMETADADGNIFTSLLLEERGTRLSIPSDEEFTRLRNIALQSYQGEGAGAPAPNPRTTLDVRDTLRDSVWENYFGEGDGRPSTRSARASRGSVTERQRIATIDRGTNMRSTRGLPTPGHTKIDDSDGEIWDSLSDEQRKEASSRIAKLEDAAIRRLSGGSLSVEFDANGNVINIDNYAVGSFESAGGINRDVGVFGDNMAPRLALDGVTVQKEVAATGRKAQKFAKLQKYSLVTGVRDPETGEMTLALTKEGADTLATRIVSVRKLYNSRLDDLDKDIDALEKAIAQGTDVEKNKRSLAAKKTQREKVAIAYRQFLDDAAALSTIAKGRLAGNDNNSTNADGGDAMRYIPEQLPSTYRKELFEPDGIIGSRATVDAMFDDWMESGAANVPDVPRTKRGRVSKKSKEYKALVKRFKSGELDEQIFADIGDTWRWRDKVELRDGRLRGKGKDFDVLGDVSDEQLDADSSSLRRLGWHVADISEKTGSKRKGSSFWARTIIPDPSQWVRRYNARNARKRDAARRVTALKTGTGGKTTTGKREKTNKELRILARYKASRLGLLASGRNDANGAVDSANKTLAKRKSVFSGEDSVATPEGIELLSRLRKLFAEADSKDAAKIKKKQKGLNPGDDPILAEILDGLDLNERPTVVTLDELVELSKVPGARVIRRGFGGKTFAEDFMDDSSERRMIPGEGGTAQGVGEYWAVVMEDGRDTRAAVTNWEGWVTADKQVDPATGKRLKNTIPGPGGAVATLAPDAKVITMRELETLQGELADVSGGINLAFSSPDLPERFAQKTEGDALKRLLELIEENIYAKYQPDDPAWQTRGGKTIMQLVNAVRNAKNPEDRKRALAALDYFARGSTRGVLKNLLAPLYGYDAIRAGSGVMLVFNRGAVITYGGVGGLEMTRAVEKAVIDGVPLSADMVAKLHAGERVN